MQRPWVSSPTYEAAVHFLVRKRQEAGISQRDLADRLGKPRSFVSKIEGKERRLDIVEFIAVVRAIGGEPGPLMAELADALGPFLEF